MQARRQTQVVIAVSTRLLARADRAAMAAAAKAQLIGVLLNLTVFPLGLRGPGTNSGACLRFAADRYLR
jgi:hypothetical protein